MNRDQEEMQIKELKKKIFLLEKQVEEANNQINFIKESNSYKLSQSLKRLVHVFAPFGSRRYWALRKCLRCVKKITPHGKNTLKESLVENSVVGLGYDPSFLCSYLNSDEEIILVCSLHTQFIAKLFKNELISLNKKVSVIIYSDSIIYDNKKLHILIAPSFFKAVPERYIIFQLEQSISSRWFTEDYFAKLSNSLAVFDYSQDNISYLQANKIPMKQIFYLPVGHCNLKDNNFDVNKREKKLIFYGDINSDHRRHLLNKLKEKYDIAILNNVFGDELYRTLASAYAVINIHYYAGSMLETTRLQECLSLGVPVISENSFNSSEYPEFNDKVIFFKEGDVESACNTIDNLLNDNDFYLDIKNRIDIYRKSQDLLFSFNLKRFFLAFDAIEFDQVAKTGSTFYKENPLSNSNKLCLTLAETLDRKNTFMKNPNDFSPVLGLRHYLGWIGCGLSYKYIFSVFRGIKNLTICEDDVVFYEDFQHKYEIIQEYLTRMDGQWEMFLGFIADAKPETKVTRIDKYKGIEFVYIDKACSTVFNIYSEKMQAKILDWDECNHDSSTNTIDRFYNSEHEFRYITILPFFIGHAEDLCSTIWSPDGINQQKNSAYNPLVKDSIERLSSKIKQFKENNKVNIIE